MGNRLGHLHEAFKKLNVLICDGNKGVRTSFLYETDPVGLKDQPKFLNARARSKRNFRREIF